MRMSIPGQSEILLAVLLVASTSGVAIGQATDDLLTQAQIALRRGEGKLALELANEALLGEPGHVQGTLLRGRIQELGGELEAALADYDQVLEKTPEAWDTHLLRGGVRFKLGQIDESIADFDRVAELRPERTPHLWQRGISYYYAGRYAEGIRQFESHRRVNPNDAENAVWHYLCVAATAGGVEEAKRRLLPVGPDHRVPMAQIYDLFRGASSAQEVLAATRADAPTSRAQLHQRLFYAHLYVGLFHHATGEHKLARKHLKKARDEYAATHYMGYVPGVHLRRAEQAKPGS